MSDEICMHTSLAAKHETLCNSIADHTIIEALAKRLETAVQVYGKKMNGMRGMLQCTAR